MERVLLVGGMAQHYMPSYSGTVPFPLVKKARGEVADRGVSRLRVWLARALFGVIFGGVLALFAYEVRSVRSNGWQNSLPSLPVQQ